MFKKLAILISLFAASPAFAVSQYGTVTSGDCVKWQSNQLIADAGSACGGGGGAFLPLAGGTMSGNIVMGGNDVTGAGYITGGNSGLVFNLGFFGNAAKFADASGNTVYFGTGTYAIDSIGTDFLDGRVLVDGAADDGNTALQVGQSSFGADTQVYIGDRFYSAIVPTSSHNPAVILEANGVGTFLDMLADGSAAEFITGSPAFLLGTGNAGAISLTPSNNLQILNAITDNSSGSWTSDGQTSIDANNRTLNASDGSVNLRWDNPGEVDTVNNILDDGTGNISIANSGVFGANVTIGGFGGFNVGALTGKTGTDTTGNVFTGGVVTTIATNSAVTTNAIANTIFMNIMNNQGGMQ